MKRHLTSILFLILFLLFTPILGAQELGRPDHVDVFPRGAHTTWILPAQEEMTLLLPSTFTSEDIRYRTRDEAVVNSMEVTLQRAGTWIPPAIKESLLKIEEIRKEMEKIKAELAGIDQTIMYLQSFSFSGEMENPLEFIAKSQELRITAEEKRQLLRHQLEESQRAIDELKQKIRKSYAGNLEEVIHITIETNGTGSIEITAFTPHASWAPSYRASLDTQDQLLVLDTYVEVQQRTGIPWNGPINCHTAAPHDHIYIPRVNPMVARIREESITRSPMAVPLMESDMASRVEKDPFPEMELIDREAGLTFTGHGQIYSTGEGVLLSVSQDILKVDLHPTLIPYQEREAWLMAETVNPVRTLLAGEVELVVDGAYTGTSRLQHAGGGESLDMAFGRSPLITADREMAVYQERRTWRGRNVLEDGYQIEVFNGTTREMEIVVIDRAPIPGDGSIDISLSIDPTPYEEENGILLWRINLMGEEKKIITVDYEIEYPDKMELLLH